jgi:UDP-N-acetylmuramate--alanine ligase
MFYRTEHIHFIGIGGAGMCPLAELMAWHTYTVSGSDACASQSTRFLESLGVKIQYDHTPDLVKQADLVVYSSAIKTDNPELLFAYKNNVRCIKRAEMLGDIMRAKFSIGVAGTHGKTTTTSLIGSVFQEAGQDPIVLVGGTLRNSGSNAIIGNGNILVAEADEYDRSFLKMYPSVAVITNIEADHLDIYRDIDDITGAFTAYAQKVPFYGFVIVCKDDPVAWKMSGRIGKKIITYGLSETADYQARSIRLEKRSATFSLAAYGKEIDTVTIPLSGIHNVRNALAAYAVARELNVPGDIIKKSLASFHGVKRRFEIIGSENGITVVDDYAHHPTEIRATLDSAKCQDFKRIIAVFQPHLYSRTRDFLHEFAAALAAADIAVVTEIYKAREEPIPGVSGQDIVTALKEKGHSHAFFCRTIDEVPDVLAPITQPGDGIILMGAGDIWKTGAPILQRIKT